MSTSLSNQTIGFVGCGKISSAVCRGYATLSEEKRPKKILVSARSRDKSSALLNDFPSLVEVLENNEDIVAQSNIIFIGLLPGVAKEVLPTLPFKPNQLVISMMAAIDYESLVSLISSIPRERIVRTIPLPSCAYHEGPILLYPALPEAISVLNQISTAVECKNEKEMLPMISITCHISTFYELMKKSQDFLIDNGLSEDISVKFVKSFYSSLANGAMRSHESLEYLSDEAATPGGFNEKSKKKLLDSDHFKEHYDSLWDILNLLTK